MPLSRPDADTSRRVDLISTNGAVVTAFALTRATMSSVILGTAFIGGFNIESTAVLLVQVSVLVVATVGLYSSLRALLRSFQRRPMFASHAWSLIALDSALAIGVMAMIDSETSPLAWVALITPVLETAVLFSMAPAGLVWLGLSLAFLALRIAGDGSDSTGSETLVLAIQQVLAVLLISGPAALMADSAQQRIDQLAEDRRSSEKTAHRLRRVAEGARVMSQENSTEGILATAARSAVAIGFDQADIVFRSESGELTLHTSHATGPSSAVPLHILTSGIPPTEVRSIGHDHESWGDALRLEHIASGHALMLSTERDGELTTSSNQAILRVWSKHQSATEQDVRALALLADHARETHRAAELLDAAETHAAQLLHEVRHDGLTGLANRAWVLETLESRINQREATALFFIDLDGFKSLNDTIGHRAGDAALVTVGERLRERSGHGSLVGRMGGDEFIVVMPVTPFDTLSTLEQFGESLVAVIGEPMTTDGHPAQLGASIGLAVHDGVVDADQLISLADNSMYDAKRAGGGLRVDPASVELYEQRKAAS